MANTTTIDEFSTWIVNSTRVYWNDETTSEHDRGTDGYNLTASNFSEVHNGSAKEYPGWFVAAICTVTTFGILLNLVFLFTVVRVPSLRTPTTYYMVNLALADITFLFIILLSTITSTKLGIHVNDTITNMVKVYMDYLLYTVAYVSALTIVALSVERFVAIYKPIRFHYLISKSRTIRAITAIWIVSALVNLPIFPLELAYTKLEESEENILWFCIYIPPVAILVIITILYIIQIIKLYQHRKRTKYMRRSTQKDKIQVMVMLTITAAVFLVCNIPFIIEGFAWRLGVKPSENFILVTIVCLIFNASVNMIIYNVVSSRYRHALVMAFSIRPARKTLSKSVSNNSLSSRLRDNRTHSIYSVM